MGFFDILFDFDPILKQAKTSKQAVALEKAIQRYWNGRYGQGLIQDPLLNINTQTATIAELRIAAQILFEEANRVEAIPGYNTVIVLRDKNMNMVFCDKYEDKVRYWALQNPCSTDRMFKEDWVNDSLTGNAHRVMRREQMDSPLQTAQDNARN